MSFFKLHPADPLYQRIFGDIDVRHFGIYTAQHESIGRIVELLTDETKRLCYAAVETGSWLSRRRVIVPLTQFQLDAADRRIYATDIRDTHSEHWPVYSEANVVSDRADIKPGLQRERRSDFDSGLVETPLESSIALENPVITGSVGSSHRQVAQPLPTQATTASDRASTPEIINYPRSMPQEALPEATIRLLEERLVIDRRRRKAGEVIVRKVIETQIVEVPIRREKLIVEQVGPERKQLAVVDLHPDMADSLELQPPSSSSAYALGATEAIDISMAKQILDKITQMTRFRQTKVSLDFEDPELQSQYQQWLAERSSQ